MSDINFVRLKAQEGLMTQGLRPLSVQVDKLNQGGYMVKALVINVNSKSVIEDAKIIPHDYRLDAINDGGY